MERFCMVCNFPIDDLIHANCHLHEPLVPEISMQNKYDNIGYDMLIHDDFPVEERKNGWSTVWKQLLAGGSAGVVSRTVTAPVDRIKVMMQVYAGKERNNWTMRRAMDKIWTEGGLKSFYRGNLTNCVKVGPEAAFKFFAYENIKGLIAGWRGKDKKQLVLHERILAGSLTGICSQFFVYPMDVVKTRLAIGKTGEYNGMRDCCKKVYQIDGIRRGLYKGLAPALIGIVPYAGIELALYETLKGIWLTNNPNTGSAMTVTFCCCSISSACGQLVSYPFVLIRTKLQAQSKDPSFTGLRANGMTDMCRVIIRENGMFGLYRGIIPNFCKAIPATVIQWIVYEHARKTLGLT